MAKCVAAEFGRGVFCPKLRPIVMVWALGLLTLALGIATYLATSPICLGCEREDMSYRLATAFVVTLALGAPAMADGLFGAIAFSPSTGKVGAGWNFASKDEASADSLARCGVGDCSAVVVFPNCGAVAVGDGFGMGFSADQSVAKAEETALANCSGYTANCLIVQSFCNEGS